MWLTTCQLLLDLCMFSLQVLVIPRSHNHVRLRQAPIRLVLQRLMCSQQGLSSPLRPLLHPVWTPRPHYHMRRLLPLRQPLRERVLRGLHQASRRWAPECSHLRHQVLRAPTGSLRRGLSLRCTLAVLVRLLHRPCPKASWPCLWSPTSIL